jgi:hypothetical protein
MAAPSSPDSLLITSALPEEFPDSRLLITNAQQEERLIIVNAQQDETVTLAHPKSRMRTLLEPLVPINCPLPWIAINSACCLGSAILIQQVLATAGPLDRPYGTQLYILWNVVTTIIWVIEVGLTVWYNAGMPRWKWIHRVELVIAFYFMIVSMRMITHQWQKPDEDITAELIDVTINSLAYFFEVIVNIRTYVLRGKAEQAVVQDTACVADDPSKTAIDYTIFKPDEELACPPRRVRVLEKLIHGYSRQYCSNDMIK